MIAWKRFEYSCDQQTDSTILYRNDITDLSAIIVNKDKRPKIEFQWNRLLVSVQS